MRRAFVLLLGLLAVGVVVVQTTAAKDEGSPGKDVLEFDVMTPVVAPFTGAAHPIRGVNGGGVPWQIDRGRGDLSSDGRLKIKVEGLVLVSSGQNPVHDVPRRGQLPDPRVARRGREPRDRAGPGLNRRRRDDQGDGRSARSLRGADRVRDVGHRSGPGQLVRGDGPLDPRA